ncbi:DUF1697 domain-containing protein [Clostridium sp. YIM B02515]|uniref:DUF1697 domain-containing protein n=1 Tax=Clostridium rhizosphaerae TaxID=2803861 RepID=A0ABS1T4U5_9CLOT|nr:DUF1697 domain-containing protein [Clostridium rhizosphaerae]MBL4934340.1 DUF1697 domain-containing protein [Clostridium rhizosphaerae]
MITYIALLRGINVGGKNIIKMAELKKVFESLGLFNVKTYIQSGNVLFKSDESEEALRDKIEHEIEAVFGISLSVVIRTAAEINQIIRNCPFSEAQIKEAEALSQVESLYVLLLLHTPLEEKVPILEAYKSENDEYKIIGRDVFLLFKNSVRNSKLAANLHRLEVPSTMRNWKTINKLADLAKDI